MAPELLQKGKMTRAADVYSFAMIMVELYTCKRLFEGLAQQQVCAPGYTCLQCPVPSDMVLATQDWTRGFLITAACDQGVLWQ